MVLPVPPERAGDYVRTRALALGLSAARRGQGVALSMPWRPPRSYLERPVAVGGFVPQDTGTLFAGVIVRTGGWFRLICWSGIAMSFLIVIVSWILPGQQFHDTQGNPPDSPLILAPILMSVIGAAVFRYNSLDSASQRRVLIDFLWSLNSPGPASGEP